jgi:pimeloyl-ACP methyl ester carboxylesterase
MRAGRFEGIERIRVPVTLAWPQFDRLVGPPRHLPPRVRSVVLRDCGHVPMWDDPEQVAQVLLAGSAEGR